MRCFAACSLAEERLRRSFAETYSVSPARYSQNMKTFFLTCEAH